MWNNHPPRRKRKSNGADPDSIANLRKRLKNRNDKIKKALEETEEEQTVKAAREFLKEFSGVRTT